MKNKMKIWASLAGIALLLIATLAITGCTSEPAVDEQPAEVITPAAPVEVTPTASEPLVPAVEAPVVEEPVAPVVEEQPLEEQVEEVQKLFDKVTKDGLKLGDAVVQSKLLFKEEVNFDEDDYTVKTYLVTTDGLKVAYSPDDEDFEAEPRLTYVRKSIGLITVLKDGFDFSKVSEEYAPDDGKFGSLELKVLGKQLEIIKADVASNEITLLKGNEAFTWVGQEVDGVKLEAVSYTSATLSCIKETHKQSVTVRDGQIGKICGNQVRVTDLSPRDSLAESSAFVRVGGDIVETVADGDTFIEDENGDAVWTWKIDLAEGKIGFELVSRAVDADDKVLKLDESLDLMGFAKLTFVADNEPTVRDYDVSFESYIVDEINSTADTEVVVFEGEFAYNDDEETKKLLWVDDTFYAKNDDNEWVSVTGVKFRDSDVELSNTLSLINTAPEVDMEICKLNILDKQIKVAVGSDENILDEDHSVLTGFGIVFDSVDDLEDVDELSFSVPEEQVEFAVEVQ